MRKTLWLAAVATVLALTAPTIRAEQEMIDQITKPTPWLSLGADLRVRETYQDNNFDLNSRLDDTRHFFHVRTRAWATVGPYGRDETLAFPNGVSGAIRLTNESFVWMQRSRDVGFSRPEDRAGQKNGINELVFDNLYLDVVRPGGIPVSIRAGRQDIVYGRGWIILDGTPLDTSRTIYNDAIKATLHVDESQAAIDAFAIHNKGRQSRLRPVGDMDYPLNRLSEYDTTLFGVVLKKNYAEEKEFKTSGELNVYYVYKDDDRLSPARDARLPGALPAARGRTVHTAGAMVDGKLQDNLDYYLEAATQWGREGGARRSGHGLNSDLGYTLPGVVATPRVHVGYEYLSGDNKNSSKYEGWDPVLGRWARFSEIIAYEAAGETGVPAYYTNLQRFTLGADCKPVKGMVVSVDYSYLLANSHTFGRAPGANPAFFNEGNGRGSLVVGNLLYEFNKYVCGQLRGEWFHPDDYYGPQADQAWFLRWELVFKLL